MSGVGRVSAKRTYTSRLCFNVCSIAGNSQLVYLVTLDYTAEILLTHYPTVDLW